MEDHRKKWDENEYEEIARRRLEEEVFSKDRTNKEEPVPVRRENLKPREYKVATAACVCIDTHVYVLDCFRLIWIRNSAKQAL